MKVIPTDQTFVHSEQLKQSGRSPEVNRDRSEFEVTLKNTAAENRKQLCETLLDKIDAAGAALQKSPSVAGIKHYRQLVREFMEEALHHSYQVETDSKWDYSGNRKEYVIVKNVNRILEELTDTLVDQEKSQIDLIAKLDEIRGMLLDLFF
ncbi:MAG: YaaR family protein [Bacillota bacterium]|jgi:uncharacterized protein YaaR (DUF327 family)